jgi:hypothetical protein
MTSTTMTPTDSPPITTVAVRATRHRLASAARTLRAFAGAAASVVLLGEYGEQWEAHRPR